MRIAYVYDAIHPYVIGGVQKRIWELARRLAQEGHEVTIFGMKHWEGENIIYKEGVRLWGCCPPQELFANGRRSIKEAIYFAWKVLPPLRQEKFDIIDCQNFPYFPCFSAKLASVLKKSILVITWHEVWGNYWYKYLGTKGIFGKIIERLSARLAQMNTAGTKNNIEKLISLGVGKHKITFIPIGGVSFSDIQKVPPAKESVDIVFVGRLVNEKGIETLLRSIAYLKKDTHKVRVAIIGEGPERGELEALAGRLDIQDRVTFWGKIESDEKVMSIMKSAKIFVYSATPEGGWSISVIEANACGLPIISVQSGTLGDNEVVIDGYNGLLIREPSAETMAEKINLILEDESLRGKLSKNAIDFAKEQDWGNLAKKVEEFYRQVIR